MIEAGLPVELASADQRKLVFVLCRELELTDGERYALTEMVTGVEGGSIRRLDFRQCGRLIDALHGAVYVRELERQRVRARSCQIEVRYPGF